MVLRKRILGVALAAGLGLATAPAGAEGPFFVAGMLDHVDPAGRTVTVGPATLKVTASTEIRDAEGNRAGWDELVERDGEHVQALATRSRPHPIAKVLLLIDEDEDGD